MEGNLLRVCDVCGQVDDHPRHVFAGPVGYFEVNDQLAESILDSELASADKNRIYREVLDTSVQQRHMDCCAEAGCPDGSCNQIIQTMPKGYVKGAKLQKHLISGAVDQVGERLNEQRVAKENK